MIVTNKTPSVISFDGGRLLPGANELDDGLWSKLKKNPLVLDMLDDERLVEGDAATIADLKPEAATKTVRETFDRGLLKSWLAAEKRPKVKKAVEEQLARVAAEGSRTEFGAKTEA